MGEEKNGSFLRSAALLFFLTVPALLFIFRSLFDFNGLYGQDAHEYLRYTKAILNYFDTWEPPGSFHWPVLYPFLGAMVSFLLEPSLALQLISIVCFSATLYFIFRILYLLYSNARSALLYVLIFGLLSPYFLRLGVCSMSDMCAIFFTCASLFYLCRFTLEKKSRAIIPAMVLAAAAILTRYPSALVLLIPFCYAIGRSYRNIRPAYLLVAMLLCGPVILPEFFFKPFFISAGGISDEWSFSNFFHASFLNPGSGYLHYHVANILFNFSTLLHPGFLLIALPLLLFVRGEDLLSENIFLFLLPLIVYLLFLSGFMIQNTRLCTFIFPMILILYYPAWDRFSAKFLSGNVKFIFLMGVVALQATLFYFAFNDFVSTNKFERSITAIVNKNRPGTPVLTLGMEGPLLTYCPEREVISLNAYLNLVPQPAMVLVNPVLMEVQWKGSKALELWKLIEPNCKNVATFEKGWKLYEYR